MALCALVLALSLGACKEKTLAKSGVLTKLEKFSLSITASDGTVYCYSIDGETKLDSKAEALGDTLEQAISHAYAAAKPISFQDMHFRTDIGKV